MSIQEALDLTRIPLPLARGLTGVIVSVTVILALLYVAGVLVFGSLLGPRETVPLLQLAWVQPTTQSFLVLSALAIASLCLGRYRALGGAWVFWTGAVFLANAILSIFYLLSWPGLLGDRGVIAQLSNTAAWLFILNYSCLALLLAAGYARQPERIRRQHALAGYVIVAVVAALVGLSSALFESALPIMIVGLNFTPLCLIWTVLLAVLVATAAVFAYRRYAAGEDTMLGYLALFLVMMAFGLLGSITGGKRYDFWWYASRIDFALAYLVMLFGFLQEGYGLFSQERARLSERVKLLVQLEAQNQELQSQAQRIQAQNDELLAANDRLRDSEQRYRSIFDNDYDAVFLTAPDGSILSANPTATKMFGYTEEELRQLGRRAIVDETDPRFQAAMEERRRTGSLHAVYTNKRADGTTFEGEVTSVIFNETSGEARTSLFVRDVSERVQAQGRIEQLAIRLQAVMSHVSDGLALSSLDDKVEYINPAGARLLGFESEEQYWNRLPQFEQLCALEYRDGRPMPRAEWPMARVLRGETLSEYEAIVHRLDLGRAFILSYSGRLVNDNAGEPILALLTYRDVTELRQAEAERERLVQQLTSANAQLVQASLEAQEREQKARQNARQMSALLVSLHEAVVVLDAHGSIVLRNQAARDISGLSDEALSHAMAHPDGRDRVLDPSGTPLPPDRWPTVRAVRGESFDDYEVILVRPDEGRRRIVSSSSVLRDPDGGIALVMLVYRDVTELRGLEQQREDFVRTISHDLRNPLTGVLGHAQILSRLLAQKGLEQEAASAQAIITGGKRMNAMIQDLVDSIRLETGQLELHLEPVDLQQLVPELVDRTGTAEDRARMRLEFGQWSPPAQADPDRLERAIANLLTNALKYSPSDRPVVISIGRQDSQVVVSVRDEGSGIPTEDQSRLFQRYYRASSDSRVEGLGLGLYVTKMVMEAHGGRVWVESEAGRGSTFYIALPLTE